MKLKTAKQMERHLKGVANHYRIQLLITIADTPGITLEALAESIKANEKTLGEHTRRLASAGLINKKYSGRSVEHRLSPYGETIVAFLKKFQTL